MERSTVSASSTLRNRHAREQSTSTSGSGGGNRSTRSNRSGDGSSKRRRTKRKGSGGQSATMGAVVRTLTCIMVQLLGSWFGFGFPTLVFLASLIAYSRFRHRQLAIKHNIVQYHRSLMYRSGFQTLFAGPLKHIAPSWVTYTETEKSHTLNAALELLWPSIKAATEEAVLASMTGVLAMYRPGFLSTLKFDVFELTNDPPKIISINTVEMDDGGIALDLRVTMRGESNIVLVAAARAFKASIRVHDLEVEATIRQLLSPLSSEPPFFEAISTSFVGKPRLSYSLQAGKIPFHLERFIQHLLSEVLANQLVWPKKIVVPMVDDEERLSYLMSSAAQGILRVRVVRAEGLINSETLGKSDPYVKAMIRGDRDVYKTKVVFNNLDPHWNETHEFQVYNMSHDTLRIIVYDRDKAGQDDVMGKCEIALDSLIPDIELDMQRNLIISGKHSAGTLYLVLQYKPFVFEPMIPKVPASDIWSAGYLYVDVRKCYNIQTDKAVAVTVDYGYESGTNKTLAVAPFHGEAVYEQGFAFPIDRFQGMQTHISFSLDRKHGTAVHEFDPEDLYSHRVGKYVEVLCDTGAVVCAHLTLRAVSATYSVGRPVVRTDSVTSRSPTASHARQGLAPSPPERDADDDDDDGNDDYDSEEDDGDDMGVGDDGWERASQGSDAGRGRSASTTSDGSAASGDDHQQQRQQQEEEEQAGTGRTTTQRRRQLREAGEGDSDAAPAHKKYLALVWAYAKRIKPAYDTLPSDVQGALVLVYVLLVVLCLSHVFQLSSVGWLCLLSTVGFGLYDAYRRAGGKPPPRVNRARDKLAENSKLTPEQVLQLHSALPMWCVEPAWDKAEWLNELLAGIWPKAKAGIVGMIDEAVCDQVDEMKKNGTLPVDAVNVDVTLGKPPLVTAVRAIKNTYINSRVMLDLDLEIGDDVHVQAAVKKAGLTLPIEVRDLCITVRCRVVLRDFVPVFPCFANLDVSLLSAPSIDFNLNVAHIPIMNFPFLSQALNVGVSQFVLRGIENMELLWPRCMGIEIFDPNDIVVKRSLRVPPAGVLRVHVRNAKGLRKADHLSESDPYVTIIYQEGNGVKVKTRVIQDEPNPVWNEHFDFIILNRARRYLTFTCKDFDRVGSHDTLGFAEVTTDALMDAPDTTIQRTFDFQHLGKPAGFLNVEFEFKPFTPTVDKRFFDHDVEEMAIGALFVDVIRCTGLPDVRAPRVTVTLGATQVTTSAKSGSNPVFHEKFALAVKDIYTGKVVFSVLENQRLRKDQKRCTLAMELKEMSHQGVMQDFFDLDGGGRIELRLDLRTVKPDEDTLVEMKPGQLRKPQLTWAEYTDLRERIEVERQEEAAKTKPSMLETKPVLSVDEDKQSPEFEADNEETPAVVGAPTKPGFLLLNIFHGQNLPAANSNGFSDPYISIECEGRKKRTQWKKRTINPEWNEKLDFRIDDPLNSVVTFHVKDHEHWSKNKVLGSFSVPISSVSTLKESVCNFQLENARGTITMGLMFQESKVKAPKQHKHSPLFGRKERHHRPDHDDEHEQQQQPSQPGSHNDSELEIFV